MKLPMVLLVAFLLSACSISFAADITPPPGLQDVSPRFTEESKAANSFPILLPDAEKGQLIYQEKCAACHGDHGLGDGPQVSQLPYPPTAIGNPTVARQKKPVEWFESISQGNLERFMPGFQASLSERQRWDVVAYLTVLSHRTDDLVEGGNIYQLECQMCHGLGGGDGSLAAVEGLGEPDWLDPSRLVGFSGMEMAELIANGSPSGSMPAYKDKLTPEQIWAVTGFIRTLGFTTEDFRLDGAPSQELSAQGSAHLEAEGVQIPAGELEPEGIKIFGSVRNVSGGNIPEEGVVLLQVFEGMERAFSLTTELESDGSYQFSSVNLNVNQILLASLEYLGFTYYSEFVPITDTNMAAEFHLPIRVYNSTSNTNGLEAERVHLFINFPEPDRMQVVELYIISNKGNEVVVPEGTDMPALQFVLPQEAENLQFEEGVLGGRYVRTADGFGDMTAILPGERPHQVFFAYELPYQRKKELSLVMPVNAQAVLVAIPAGKVKLQSTKLVDSGQRDVDGTLVQLYSANDISKGSSLSMNISGRPAITMGMQTGTPTDMLIGLGALGVSLLIAGVWFSRVRAKKKQESFEDQPVPSTQVYQSAEAVLDEIVALDDIYKAGELSEEAYLDRRADLKRFLKMVQNGSREA